MVNLVIISSLFDVFSIKLLLFILSFSFKLILFLLQLQIQNKIITQNLYFPKCANVKVVGYADASIPLNLMVATGRVGAILLLTLIL